MWRGWSLKLSIGGWFGSQDEGCGGWQGEWCVVGVFCDIWRPYVECIAVIPRYVLHRPLVVVILCYYSLGWDYGEGLDVGFRHEILDIVHALVVIFGRHHVGALRTPWC